MFFCIQDPEPVSNGPLGGSPKDSTDEEADGAFDVSKIKGKLARRPPKGVGAAKKETVKEKKGADKKPKKACFALQESQSQDCPGESASHSKLFIAL